MVHYLGGAQGMLRVAWDSSGHVLECSDKKVRLEGDRVAVSARVPVDFSQRRY